MNDKKTHSKAVFNSIDWSEFQQRNKEKKDKRNKEIKEKAKEGDHIVKTSFGLFNLDNEETYKLSDYKDFSPEELNKRLQEEIGKALAYMLCYMPARHDVNWDDRQYKRVVEFGQKYYKTYYEKYAFKEPTEDQRLWARKQLWLFEEETENMC